MGTGAPEAALAGDRENARIPTDASETRMDVGSTLQIVILVVVGSSPISHPKKFN